MRYAIVFGSKTGNTRLLAEAIRPTRLENFDSALAHPDEGDLARLRAALRA